MSKKPDIIDIFKHFKRYGYCEHCDHEEFKLPVDHDDNIIAIVCAKCGYEVPLSDDNPRKDISR